MDLLIIDFYISLFFFYILLFSFILFVMFDRNKISWKKFSFSFYFYPCRQARSNYVALENVVFPILIARSR